jgi:hypothetical protein
MKLYERLGDKGFHTCVVTTFGVEFDAYETIALSRLRGSGCHNNLLVVDRGMLSHALSGASSLPRFAGRHYHVSAASASGVFHPKIILQLGRKQGRVIIASANATASGLAGNLEIAGIIECDQNESPEQRFVAAAWHYAGRFFDRTQFSLNHHLLWAEQRTPWLRRTEAADGLLELSDGTAAEFLATTGNSGILERFLATVDGDKIRRLIVISPYWDDELTAFRDLHTQLQPQQTLLLIDMQRALFPNSALDDLDTVHLVDIGSVTEGRFVHAKLFLAESEGADHVLFGSANCTFAALGRAGFRGLNEECCLYRRVPVGVISRELDLDRLIDEAGFTDASDLPPRRSYETLPLTDLAESSPGTFELHYDKLIWRPSPIFRAADGEIELLDSDLSALPSTIRREVKSPAGEVHATVHDLRKRPFFARIRTEDGHTSLPAIISVADILRTELKETGNRSIDRIVGQLDEETEEGLWLLDILDRLEKESISEDEHGVATIHRNVPANKGPQQFEVVDYDAFVAGRHLRGHGTEAARNSLAGTEFSLIRAFLNRVISLQSSELESHGDDDDIGFTTATNLSDEVTDIEELPTADVRNIQPDQTSVIGKARNASRHMQNQEHIDKAVTRFIDHTRHVAEYSTLTSMDLLRLQALLRIIIAAGLPCSEVGLEKKKKKCDSTNFQVLPWRGSEVTWPRLLGKLLFAIFGGTSPAIKRLTIEAFHDQIPDDFLEFWACCFWAIHARIQASRDQPVRGSETLLERIYLHSGLSKEDRQHPKVIHVMDMIGEKFAVRLGLSQGDIMRSHASVN